MKRIIASNKIFNFILICCFLTVGLEGAVITAGPAGDYATIQKAIDKAISIGGNNEIRVQTGSYLENLEILAIMISGSLDISGGWDSTFNFQKNDPTLTAVDGNAASRVMTIMPTGGIINVSNLTITGGLLPSPTGSTIGSGICVALMYGHAETHITGCHIIKNKIIGTRAVGGGVMIYLRAETRASVTNCVVMQNEIYGTDSIDGAGIAVTQWDRSHVEISGNKIQENYGESWTAAMGGGICYECYNESTFEISNNFIYENEINTPEVGECLGGGIYIFTSYYISGDILDNIIESNRTTGGGDSSGAGGIIKADRHCGCTTPDVNLNIRRNFWLDNEDHRGDLSVSQLYLYTRGKGTVSFSDSVIAGGNVRGAYIEAMDDSIIHSTNLTVADYYDWGLRVSTAPTATLSLYNSIAYGTGTDLTTFGPVDTGSNLVGIDPHFVSPASRNYSLLSTSPAIDAGDNSPPGGLGSLDIKKNPRIANGIVDIGAYEYY